MAYDQDLVERLRILLANEPVLEMRMFGGLAFLTNGHLAVAVSGQGGIMVRTDPAQTEALAREPGAVPLEMRGRPMKGRLRVHASSLDSDDVLRDWATRGLDYARSLPPKRQRLGA